MQAFSAGHHIFDPSALYPPLVAHLGTAGVLMSIAYSLRTMQKQMHAKAEGEGDPCTQVVVRVVR